MRQLSILLKNGPGLIHIVLARENIPVSLPASGEKTDSSLFQPPKTGGARRDRTADLLRARQALSQLSYGPARMSAPLVGLGRLELPTSPLSGVRSNQTELQTRVTPRGKDSNISRHNSKPGFHADPDKSPQPGCTIKDPWRSFSVAPNRPRVKGVVSNAQKKTVCSYRVVQIEGNCVGT